MIRHLVLILLLKKSPTEKRKPICLSYWSKVGGMWTECLSSHFSFHWNCLVLGAQAQNARTAQGQNAISTFQAPVVRALASSWARGCIHTAVFNSPCWIFLPYFFFSWFSKFFLFLILTTACTNDLHSLFSEKVQSFLYHTPPAWKFSCVPPLLVALSNKEPSPTHLPIRHPPFSHLFHKVFQSI